MKSVTKFIMCSCLFCYFAGLWIIASRFGLIKLISRYGLAEAFDQIPKDFPQMKYLYIGLAVYSVLFLILSGIIIKYSGRSVKEQEHLQQEVSVLVSYTERMKILLSQYERSDIKDARTKQELQTLSRKIASLPPVVVRNNVLKAEVSNIVGTLQDLLSDNCSADTFIAAVDKARDAVDSIKRKSITIN